MCITYKGVNYMIAVSGHYISIRTWQQVTEAYYRKGNQDSNIFV